MSRSDQLLIVQAWTDQIRMVADDMRKSEQPARTGLSSKVLHSQARTLDTWANVIDATADLRCPEDEL